MKTILELIESWDPCPRYNTYVNNGSLKAGMTTDDILRSTKIANEDKAWFFEYLLVHNNIDIIIYGDTVEVRNNEVYLVKEYSYSGFLAMVDEYLEHADIDAAM